LARLLAQLLARLLAGLLAGTIVWGAGAAPAMAADAVAPAAASPATPASPAVAPCPLTSPEHTARLVAPAVAESGGAAAVPARVGTPLSVVVALEGPPLPSGVFPVVNIDKASGPDGGRVSSTTGYPESEVRFSAPGRYELALTVTLVARSSCGGAKARTVMERRVAVQVAP
jgi:hypothetical protein